MRIGVVSDTHGHIPNAQSAVRMLESCEVELVIHCGDIGSPEVIRLFDPWPTHFVFGNVDGDLPALRAAMKAGGHTCHERKGELELAERRIAFLHGDDGRMFGQLLSSGDFDLICHGHTHVAMHRIQGRTHVLNPGALYRAPYHSIALVDLPQLEITEIRV
jgi:putative phosphoesterase